MKNLIGIEDFSKSEIDELIEVSKDIIDNKGKYSEKCKGKILATLFFEPSTRTRLSFESAMISLGGNVIGFSSSDNTSTSKGETLSDTIKVVSGYCDIIAMRHPKEGAPLVASMNSKVPIINAGDGGHNHPTQTMLDLLTISKERGRLDNLKIGICGDLKFGRTVHSLITALSLYNNIKFKLISPKELKIPDYIRTEVLDRNNIEYAEMENLEDNIQDLDILYMTRVQKERFLNEEDYVRLKDVYILNKEKMKRANNELCVLHPLPRVNEIAQEVDNDPRACYFKQAEYGRYMRMAIILKLLKENNNDNNITINIIEDNKKVKKFHPELENELVDIVRCKNPRCITSIERGLKQICILKDRQKAVYRCKYCDSKV